MRHSVWMWAVGLAGATVMVGCGGGSSSQSVHKDFRQPLAVMDRLDRALSRMVGAMDEADYNIRLDGRLPMLHAAAVEQVPLALVGPDMKDDALREQLQPVVDRLVKTYTEKIQTPLEETPPNREAAKVGIEECKAISAELRDILGG